MSNVNVLIFLFLFVKFTNAAIQLDDSCLNRPESCDDDAFSVADWIVCGGDEDGDSAFGEALVEVDKGDGNRAKDCYVDTTCQPVVDIDTEISVSWSYLHGVTFDDGTTNYVKAQAVCNSYKIMLNSPIYVNARDWNEKFKDFGPDGGGVKLEPIWQISDNVIDLTNQPLISTANLADQYKTAKDGTAADLTTFEDKWILADDQVGPAKQIKDYTVLKTHLDALLSKRAACVKWFTDGTSVCVPPNGWFIVCVSVGVIALIAGLFFGLMYWKNKPKTPKKAPIESSATDVKQANDDAALVIPIRNFRKQNYHRRGPRVFSDGI